MMTKNGRFLWSAIILFAVVLLIVSMLEETARTREKKLEREAVSEKIAGLTQSAQAAEREGRYGEALKLSEDALKAAEAEYGGNHQVVANALENLGIVYSRLEKHEQARECDERALEIRRKLFGEEHELTADSLNNLGVDYSNLGEHLKAKECDERALAIRLELFGEEHADTAQSLNNLGVDYASMGDYYAFHTPSSLQYTLQYGDYASVEINGFFSSLEGEGDGSSMNYIEEAREIRERLFGNDNADPEQSFYNKAILLDRIYGLNFAVVSDHRWFHTDALQVRELFLGEEHAATAAVLNNMGIHYRLEGYVQSDEFLGDESYEEVKERYERALESYERAKECDERALAIRTKLFGEENADTAQSFHNLGIDYRLLDKYEDAKKCDERALAIRLKVYGEDHLETAASLKNLGFDCYVLGDHAKEKEYTGRVLVIYSKAFGFNYPKDNFDYAKSEKISQNTSGSIFGQFFSLEYPKRFLNNDRASGNGVGLAFGNYEKAKKCDGLNLTIRVKVFGEESIGDFRVDSLLRGDDPNCAEYGDYEKLTERDEHALAVYTKVFGKDNAYVAHFLNYLAIDYLGLGNYEEANKHHERALAIWANLFGEDNHYAAESFNAMGILYGKLGEYGKAREHHVRALEIALNLAGKEMDPDPWTFYYPYDFDKKLVGDDSTIRNNSKFMLAKLMIVDFLKNLGSVEKLLGNDESQKTCFRCAAAIEAIDVFPANKIEKVRFYGPLFEIQTMIFGKKREESPSFALKLAYVGAAYSYAGVHAKAQECLLHALAIYLKLYGENHSGTIMSIFYLGENYRRMKSNTSAIFCWKEVVNTPRGEFLDYSDSAVHAILIDLLVEEGRLPEAQQVMKMLKEKGFLHFYQRNEKNDKREISPTFTTREQKQLDRLWEIGRQLFAKYKEKEELLKKKEIVSDPERLREVNAALENLTKDLFVFFDNLETELEIERNDEPQR